MDKKKIIWKDRKRTIFGLPLSFTVYTLTGEKLLIDTGFLNKRQEEIMLFRITDVTLIRRLSQRIFGVGTIHCCSADKTTPEFDITNIKDAKYGWYSYVTRFALPVYGENGDIERYNVFRAILLVRHAEDKRLY